MDILFHLACTRTKNAITMTAFLYIMGFFLHTVGNKKKKTMRASSFFLADMQDREASGSTASSGNQGCETESRRYENLLRCVLVDVEARATGENNADAINHHAKQVRNVFCHNPKLHSWLFILLPAVISDFRSNTVSYVFADLKRFTCRSQDVT